MVWCVGGRFNVVYYVDNKFTINKKDCNIDGER